MKTKHLNKFFISELNIYKSAPKIEILNFDTGLFEQVKKPDIDYILALKRGKYENSLSFCLLDLENLCKEIIQSYYSSSKDQIEESEYILKNIHKVKEKNAEFFI